jgi:hypothetical protein
MPMQVKYITNADKCGDHLFELVKREGNVHIYKRTVVETGKVFGYEVFVSKVVKAGTIFVKGGKPTESDYESYPGKSGFGISAWFCSTLENATTRFDEIIKGKLKVEDVEEEPVEQIEVTIPPPPVARKVKVVIPVTEFNQDQFLTVNDGMDTKTVEKVLKALLKQNLIKETNHKGYYLSLKKG